MRVVFRIRYMVGTLPISLTQEETELYRASHEDFPGEWGQLHAHIFSRFASEGFSNAWRDNKVKKLGEHGRPSDA